MTILFGSAIQRTPAVLAAAGGRAENLRSSAVEFAANWSLAAAIAFDQCRTLLFRSFFDVKQMDLRRTADWLWTAVIDSRSRRLRL